MSRGALASSMTGEPADIYPFRPEDAAAVAAMVREVFDERVAGSFEPAGIAEMHRHVAAEGIAQRAQTHTSLVAWDGNVVVGVVEVRDMSHVSMLFVRTSHTGRGIATALMARVTESCRAAGCSKMTVNASLNARSFYESLGFVATEAPQRIQGFAFVPMEKAM